MPFELSTAGMDELRMHGGNSSNGESPQEVVSMMEVLTRIDFDLASSSEKLMNLHVLLMHLLAWDNDLDLMAVENGYMSAASAEKALLFDLLSGILDSELREVEDFINSIQAQIIDSRQRVSSFRHLKELFTMMEEKLRILEGSLKKSQEHVLEVKMQSTKLQCVFSVFRLENGEDNKAGESSANGQLSNSFVRSKSRIADKQTHILRMLEKSLAKELEFEKKKSEIRRNEEQLKLKLYHTEQLALHMEEAAEMATGRFFEAENGAVVLMGISKEMAGRLQIVQFNLNGSLQREAELKSKLQYCIQQLDTKDTALKKLENNIAEHMVKSSQVPALMEKVNSLEEQLRKSEIQLKNTNVLYAESQEHLIQMENAVESLKESMYDAESRAETAETKVKQLTDSNSELTEEVNFLKGSRDSSTKKVTLLEKQLRELEIQAQNSKVSAEASAEQQNMLYSAIWDMETLIEDLKSKVSIAESKTESVEDQCIELSESNSDLTNEISSLRSRLKALETSLDKANKLKAASVKEINLRNKLITDAVMQLAKERESLQNQLFSLSRENEILLKLRNIEGDPNVIKCSNGDDYEEELLASDNISPDDTSRKTCEEPMPSG